MLINIKDLPIVAIDFMNEVHIKKYFIEVVPSWLIQHIQSMDTVTAIFFKTGLSPCAIR